uniref:Uncharacterized protein n=1 Tax=Varanus komodoensis TaxID=61221 RepID=A0A8D2IUK7_VARKO
STKKKVLSILPVCVFQIDCLEDKLSHCRQALEELDFKLQREELTPERRY